MSLKTDYVDALFSGSRKYRVIENEDGTVSFEDVTEYTQAGDSFGAKDVNETNAAVISLQNEQIETVDPMVTTEAGFAADAAATREAIEEVSANIDTVQSNLDTIEGNFSTAANDIGDAIAALGVSVPAGTPLSSMAAIITNGLMKNIYGKTDTITLSTSTVVNPGNVQVLFTSASPATTTYKTMKLSGNALAILATLSKISVSVSLVVGIPGADNDTATGYIRLYKNGAQVAQNYYSYSCYDNNSRKTITASFGLNNLKAGDVLSIYVYCNENYARVHSGSMTATATI